jgi:hypothetical protein
VVELLKAFVSGSTWTISEFHVKRAIIRKGYNIYPTGQHQFVQNVFALNTEVDSSPLIGLRILRLLRDAKHHDAGGLEDYVTIEQALDYLQAMGIERRATLMCLDVMLKTGLCYSYDPTIRDITNASKIQLSPSGLQHLHWGSWDETYISTMLRVTPISSEAVYNRLQALSTADKQIRWCVKAVTFLQHLLDEDEIYTNIIDHPAYEGQQRLIKAIRKKIERLEYEFL